MLGIFWLIDQVKGMENWVKVSGKLDLIFWAAHAFGILFIVACAFF